MSTDNASSQQWLRRIFDGISGQQTDALTDAQLRASRVAVVDKDPALEVLADQSGPGVLTFTFSAPSQPWVYADGDAPVRVTDATQTPTGALGIPVPPGSPFPVPVETTELRVLAGPGQTVTVYGTR